MALITQRLTFAQHMLHSFLGLLLAAEGKEGLALQIPQVLLAHPSSSQERPSRKYDGKLRTHYLVIFRNVPRAFHHVQTQLQAGQSRLTQDRDIIPWDRRAVPLAYQGQDVLLGVVDALVLVHADMIALTQESQGAGFQCGT